jgi:hypothetical protein
VPLPLLLALVLAPAPGSVELERATWEGLRAASPAEQVVPAWAANRAITLTPVAGGVLLRARWTLRSLSQGAWFSGQVLGDMPGLRLEELRWDGKPAVVAVGGDGVTVAGKVSGRATIELVAFVPGDPLQGPLTLRVMPATRGRTEAGAPEGLVAALQVPGGAAEAEAADESVGPVAGPVLQRDGAFWSGAGALELAYVSPPAPASAATAVVVARAGIGVTVGDAELRGRARLVWELRRGSIDAVSFRAEGVGADLEVTGVGVRAVQRSGGGVRVELQAPVSGRVELDLRWSAPIGAAAESRAALPQIVFEGVFRGESALQLARDGEVEVVPEASGWTPVSAAALPGWAQGLVEGTPSAAFTASSAASGSLTLLRFVPLEGPPVVVDVAAYTIATSREGRALIRAHYEVRNERAASLRIRPPPGFEILGVRVAGETAVIARDREGAWRVPLQRSVDTVSGLLSFPVEVALLGEAKPWARRERRELPLPRLDAPVAVTRVTVHLPPGYRSRLRPGDGEVVDAFTKGEGITYGLGVGEVGASQADALFQGAVKRWLANDFKGAQAELDQLKGMGASNENIARLQGNLDLISGRGGQQDATAQRRIREQAKARAVDEQVALEQLQKQAEESRKSGDYGAAARQYQAALEVGDRLAQLEQKESVEQQSRNDALRSELKSTAEEAERSVVSKKAGRYRAPRRVDLKRSGKLGFGSKSKSTYASSTGTAYDDADGLADSKDAPAPAPSEGEGEPMYEFVIDGAAVRPDGDAGKREIEAEADKPVIVPMPAAAADEPPAPVEDAQRAFGGVQATIVQEFIVEKDSLEARPSTPMDPMDQIRNAPIGGATRDFTAVIDASPAATSDAAGVRLSGSTGAESRYVVDGQSASRSAFGAQRRRRASRQQALASPATPPPAPPVKNLRSGVRGPSADQLDTKPEAPPPDKPRAPAPGLPAPKVTASAVSVVVPTVGAAVLYQRLLLPADAVHTVELSAREPLISRD